MRENLQIIGQFSATIAITVVICGSILKFISSKKNKIIGAWLIEAVLIGATIEIVGLLAFLMMILLLFW